MTGEVHLIGAGPGDPELLTVKAVRLLRNAEVVLHDELIGHDILQLVPSSAQIYNVGKRCGKQTISQHETNSLMVILAQSGQDVIRLKGGDPSIFGRLGEEITALREAGIRFEIVPGISAALAAASRAQISLTHREVAHAVVFVTGHEAAGSDRVNFRGLVATGATLVIYMPGSSYPEIARKLTHAGMAQETPCAIVSNATTPDEKIFPTTVGELARAPRLAAPTLLIVGKVLQPLAFKNIQQKIESMIELLHWGGASAQI
jgi:uroporphyrin-III C-methyltransferase